MPTGDLKNNLRRLQTELRLMKYPEPLDIPGLTQGDAKAFMPLYHYAFTSFNTALAGEIASKDIVLFAKSDAAFMDSVYRILRDMFTYKPMVTKTQFFSAQFAERKVIMCVEVLQLVQKRCRVQQPSKLPSTLRLNSSTENVAKPPSGRIRPKSATLLSESVDASMPPPAFKPTSRTDGKKSLNRSTSASTMRVELKKYKSSSRTSLPGPGTPRVVKEILDHNRSCDFSATPSIARVKPQSVEVITMPRQQDDSIISITASTPDQSLSEPGGGGDAAGFLQALQTLNGTVNDLMKKVEDLETRFTQMELMFDLQKATQANQAKEAPPPPVTLNQIDLTNQGARIQLLENRLRMLEHQVQESENGKAKSPLSNVSHTPSTPNSIGKSGAFVTVESFVNGESKVRKMAREAEAKIRAKSGDDEFSPIRKSQTIEVSLNNNNNADDVFTMIPDPEPQRSSTPSKGDNMELKFVDTPTHDQAERIKHLMKTTEDMLVPAKPIAIPADEVKRVDVD